MLMFCLYNYSLKSNWEIFKICIMPAERHCLKWLASMIFNLTSEEKSNDFSQNCQRIKLSKTERDRPRTSPLELVHLTRSDGLSRDRPRMFAVRLAVPR